MFEAMARVGLGLVAPDGPRARLSVLIFHRVLPAHDPLAPDEPTASEFESIMQLVQSAFNVIPLRDAVVGLTSGRLPQRAMAITFDDGYANNATLAAPILERLGLHATFFVATGFLDGGCMFNDVIVESIRAFKDDAIDLGFLHLGTLSTATDAQRAAAVARILAAIKYRPMEERRAAAERVAQLAGLRPPGNLMMTSEQVQQLARRGFAIGGHTVTHPILARLGEEAARHEIEAGKRQLEAIIGAPIDLFAYPNGRPRIDYVAATTRLVRQAGFKGAVTTSDGAASAGSDPFQVPRFTPWERRPLPFLLRLWRNLALGRPTYATA